MPRDGQEYPAECPVPDRFQPPAAVSRITKAAPISGSMTLDLTDEEHAALVRVLQRLIDEDRFPLAPRWAPIKAILAKLDPPAPQPAPLPPLKPGLAPGVGRGGKNRLDRGKHHFRMRETKMSLLIDPSLTMVYYTKALAYQFQAEKLFEQMPQVRLPLQDLIYSAYHHSAELALKACLLSHDVPVEREHSTVKLFKQCQQRQLLRVDDGHDEFLNLLVFLDGEDDGIGYRYDNRNEFAAQLSWVQEIVDKIIKSVEPDVKAWGEENDVNGPWDPHQVTKLRFVFSKMTHANAVTVRRTRP